MPDWSLQISDIHEVQEILAAQPAPAVRMGKLAIILGLLAAIGPFSIDSYLPAFNVMVAQLHAPQAQIQWSVGVYFMGFGLGQLFYGSLSDRIGRTIPLYVGLTLFIVGAAGCAIATTGWQLIGFRVVQALGGCAQIVISRAIVRDRFHARDAAKFYSMMMLVSGLAPILAPLIGGWLLVHIGWRSIFWFMASLGGLVFVLVLSVLEESHPPERRSRMPVMEIIRSYGRLFRDRPFIGCAFSGAVYSGSVFAYLAGSPFIYMGIYHIKPEHYGFYFAINAAGLMAAGQLNRLLLRRFEILQILRVAFLVVVVATTAIALQTATGWGGLPALLVPMFLLVSSFGTIMPLTTALAMASQAKLAGNASAILGASQFLLSGLAGILVGALNNGTAVPMGMIIMLCGVGGFLINRFAIQRTDFEMG